ncbi:hypothetical protein CW706_00010 [Candidatus Bathyarchaeota archaeon]|nr:MAG: hypothetical protein CW706_00010 [Candidatus Bathyarchaeota archaeon]
MSKDSPLKEKVEEEFEEKDGNLNKLVETLMESFLRSNSNYGAITDIETDINRIYDLVRKCIKKRRMKVYALKIDDRILLSKTNEEFSDLYEVIKECSDLQIKKDMIEIWDDAKNRILHLLITPVRKHFPLRYKNSRQRLEIIKKISSMTWSAD